MTAPPVLKNEVIRASAGSGKTFQLSNRFLALAAHGVSLDTILATTFTRKAAAEILGRVLLRLAEAALSQEKLLELAGQLQLDGLDQTRCLTMLAEMARRLHRLRVGTLDSFFLQIARSFTLELGLAPGWQIVDEIEDGRIRAEAVRQMLQRRKKKDLVTLVRLLNKGQAARSVSQTISGLVEGLYTAIYVESQPGAWQRLRRRKPMNEGELARAIEELAAAGQAPEFPEDQRFNNAHARALEAARRGDWGQFACQGLAAKIIRQTPVFYGMPIPKWLQRAYEPLIRQAQAAIVNQVADRTEAARRLLEHFDEAYQRLKRQRRAMRFDDVTRALGRFDQSRNLEDESYRLDAALDHLLLDEFQDTSAGQWRALRPLAKHVADGSGQRSFFCVGDVKQAIYGWRGGMADIFDALEDQLPGLSGSTLPETRRCGPAIIQTVNRVFERLAHNRVLDRDRYQPGARHWGQRFEHHTTAAKDLPSFCRLVAAPRATEQDDNQTIRTWRFAAEQIKRLHEQAPGFTIGVLVRRNDAVARIIYELRQCGLQASEEGGNPLSDSPAVELILSLLTLADHPGHTAARFHLACSPLGPAVGLDDWQDHAAALRLARQIRRRLVEEGYGPVIEGWAAALAPHCDARDQDRLEQLVGMAYQYDPKASLRPDDFVDWVRQTRVEDPQPSDVRVMTIHQAKGLEFDIVVLPELNAPLIGRTPGVVAGRSDLAGPIDRVVSYVNESERALLPKRFQKIFAEHDRREVEESLCLVYVAMTRARHALHLIVNPSAENERSLPKTMAGVLRAALTDGKPLEPGSIPYQEGDPEWFRRAEPRPPEAAAPAEPVLGGPMVIRLAPAGRRVGRGLERRTPSQLEGGGQLNLAQRLQLQTAESLHRGTLIHAWFQQIEWLDQAEPDDQTLADVAARLGVLAGPQLAPLIGQFRQAIRTPAVRAALSRASYQQPAPAGTFTGADAGPQLAAPHWQLWRERPFALRQHDTILSGTIDRVVVLYDGDQPIGADVLDFKTDVLPASNPVALEARLESYRPQLAAYALAAAQLWGLKPARVSARIIFTELGQVVPL
ncbi:MAG: UvrD-helicase domain-containing protein [Thermoguttaceae bacterium]